MREFRVDIDPARLDALRDRLGRTVWPDEPDAPAWSLGTDPDYLRGLVEHWRDRFDWSAAQAGLNAYPQFLTEIDDVTVHFVHARGVGPRPLPLVFTHGWPSSYAELLPLVPALTDPAAHGGDAADAFDVVIPSIPGFGFSTPYTRTGPRRVHDLWAELMTRLGYGRFGAAGGDIGARISSRLGHHHTDRLLGLHLSSVDLEVPSPRPDDLDEQERDYLARCAAWDEEEGGYRAQQRTRPQTLAYALADSPVGLAAWIVEKFRAWSDCGGDISSRFGYDELLTTITLYWLTGTINSANRWYSDFEPLRLPPGTRIEVPTGIAMFPGEAQLLVPRRMAERCYNVHRWTEPPRGGHFPALEEPELLIDDLRAFFRPLRA